VFMAAGSFISGEATFSFGYAPTALAIHLGTVIPALFLGGAMFMMRKGTALHKILVRVWAVLMMTTAISSFWLQGMTGGIGLIHIFSVITLVSIPRAIWAIRKGDVEAHRQAMTGPYVGLVVAGLFSFLPGRMMGDLAFALLG
jgi:uncharacterized membrane protein